jgi:23S rRNA (adenine2503-C2)-methyltransferase
MQYLFGKTLFELTEIVERYHQKPFVAKQLASWLYKNSVLDIQSMSNLSLSFRNELEKEYIVGLNPYLKVTTSKDGTKKYLFEYFDKVFVEAVTIFDKDRVTLCISTQAGCKMNCKFCATGKQGFNRNLSSNEILNIFRQVDEYEKISNIVFMGMGEPLDNYENVRKVIEVFTSNYGYAFSPHRLTVSTAGYLPFLKNLLEETQVDVAISLHNPIAEERKLMMPIENAYPIEKTIELLKQYSWHGQRHLTFEYILFKNLNDNQSHIKALCRLLDGLVCRINLIKFHTIPNTEFVGVEAKEMKEFCDNLTRKGLLCTIRASKGEDILAACGLLSTKEQGKTKEK